MENEKSYSALFERYGSPSEEAEIRFYGYLTRPDKLDTFKRIRDNDDRAARMIADCKHLVAQLTAYRQDLAKRYNELATMPSRDRLLLERAPHYSGKIIYYIRFFTDYEDGTTVCTASEAFEGRDRHKAIARFEELKKQRPGIEAIKDIEKRSWEK